MSENAELTSIIENLLGAKDNNAPEGSAVQRRVWSRSLERNGRIVPMAALTVCHIAMWT